MIFILLLIFFAAVEHAEPRHHKKSDQDPAFIRAIHDNVTLLYDLIDDTERYIEDRLTSRVLSFGTVQNNFEDVRRAFRNFYFHMNKFVNGGAFANMNKETAKDFKYLVFDFLNSQTEGYKGIRKLFENVDQHIASNDVINDGFVQLRQLVHERIKYYNDFLEFFVDFTLELIDKNKTKDNKKPSKAKSANKKNKKIKTEKKSNKNETKLKKPEAKIK